MHGKNCNLVRHGLFSFKAKINVFESFLSGAVPAGEGTVGAMKKFQKMFIFVFEVIINNHATTTLNVFRWLHD